MRAFLCLLMCLELLFAQTVVVPIPGERQPPPPSQPSGGGGGGGGGGLGVVIGAVAGTLLLSLILSKALPAKAKEPKADRNIKPLFVPFEFIVVYKGSLPGGLEELERASFEDINFSLIRWEKSQKELEEALSGKVLFVQPNYLYELEGKAIASEERVSQKPAGGGRVCLLDTGANLELLKDSLLGYENHLREPDMPEDHGTASGYLLKSLGASFYLHRVCSGGRCTSMAVAKGLLGCFKEGLRVVATPFGLYGAEDRLVSLLLSGLSRVGIRVVAPVGNEVSKSLPFPASHPSVIKVAGDPCFPQGLCEPYPKEPYRVLSVDASGRQRLFVGTSFSSVIHAGRLSKGF